jgi:hypothetical protein
MAKILGCFVCAWERMQRAELDADPLYEKDRAAEYALHDLWVTLHYRSCESGNGLASGK